MNTLNNNQAISPKTFLKVITIIHLALLAGQLLFSLAAFYVAPGRNFSLDTAKDLLIFVVPIIAISSFFMSNFMFKKQLDLAIAKSSLDEKLAGYQTALIVRFALLEGSSLFGIVAYLLSGNLLFLAISGLLVLYFITIRPTRNKVETDLNLDYQEKTEMGGML